MLHLLLLEFLLLPRQFSANRRVLTYRKVDAARHIEIQEMYQLVSWLDLGPRSQDP